MMPRPPQRSPGKHASTRPSSMARQQRKLFASATAVSSRAELPSASASMPSARRQARWSELLAISMTALLARSARWSPRLVSSRRRRAMAQPASLRRRPQECQAAGVALTTTKYYRFHATGAAERRYARPHDDGAAAMPAAAAASPFISANRSLQWRKAERGRRRKQHHKLLFMPRAQRRAMAMQPAPSPEYRGTNCGPRRAISSASADDVASPCWKNHSHDAQASHRKCSRMGAARGPRRRLSECRLLAQRAHAMPRRSGRIKSGAEDAGQPAAQTRQADAERHIKPCFGIRRGPHRPRRRSMPTAAGHASAT